jgi:hypothetical protein
VRQSIRTGRAVITALSYFFNAENGLGDDLTIIRFNAAFVVKVSLGRLENARSPALG